MKQHENCPSTYLSIDHRTQLEIAVNLRDSTVELRCAGLEMKMHERVLGRLIDACEQAQAEIDITANRVLSGETVTTRVECDNETPLAWSKVGDLMELTCGTVVMQVTRPALAALIRGARLAHSGLKQHLAAARGNADNISHGREG
jgi:hypothetical protein